MNQLWEGGRYREQNENEEGEAEGGRKEERREEKEGNRKGSVGE